MKKYLITGLLVWVPILVTVIVIRFFLELIDTIVEILPHHLQPQVLFGFNIPGLGLLLAIIILILTGVFAANLFGRKVVSLWEDLLAKIPLVRSIYKAVKQSMQVIFSPTGQSFRQVVMIEYPRKGIWSLGFVTNEGDESFPPNFADESLVTVFVPTTPNPTSGFLLFVPLSAVKMLDMPVDEALKAVISLGTVTPGGEHIQGKQEE